MASRTFGSPFLGRIGLHGERVNLRAHAPAQRCVHLLVSLHARPATERGTHDHRLEMVTVALHCHVFAGKAVLDPALDLVRVDHSSYYERARQAGRSNHQS